MSLNVPRLRSNGGTKGSSGFRCIACGEQVETALGELCGSGRTGGVHGAFRIMAGKMRRWRRRSSTGNALVIME
jgi:hypothetical protein